MLQVKMIKYSLSISFYPNILLSSLDFSCQSSGLWKCGNKGELSSEAQSAASDTRQLGFEPGSATNWCKTGMLQMLSVIQFPPLQLGDNISMYILGCSGD